MEQDTTLDKQLKEAEEATQAELRLWFAHGLNPAQVQVDAFSMNTWIIVIGDTLRELLPEFPSNEEMLLRVERKKLSELQELRKHLMEQQARAHILIPKDGKVH
jgi:hypothetical protein